MNADLILIFSFGLATTTIGLFFIPTYIDFLISHKIGKNIRENATIGKALEFMKLHQKKVGTPTMGGAAILGVVFFMVLISVLLQKFGFMNHSLLNQKETYLSLFTLLSVGILGAIDDYLNIRGIGKTKGMSARVKMLGLTIFATLGALWFFYKLGWGDVDMYGDPIRTLSIPFWQNLEIGYWFIPLFIFVIVAGSNSVNITDGLDGLAGGLLLFSYCVYAFICYDQGLLLLSALCVTIIGAIIAFLWYNIKPAKLYMGDVGSLALGANLGIMAMLTNTLFVFVIVGAVFILETLSVIIQLSSKKLRNGKKVFKIAPFHHHLEAIGWGEETVVFRMWLIGIILSVVGIIFYKLQ